MAENTYIINKPKSGCIAVGLFLFGIGMIIASVASLGYNFSISTLIVTLVTIAIGTGICYSAFVMVMNKKITINDNGITVTGLGVSHKQQIAWNEIVSILTRKSPDTGEDLLEIKTTKSGLPIFLHKKWVSEFGDLTSDLNQQFAGQQNIAKKKISQQAHLKPEPNQASFDKKPDTQDLIAIRAFCQHLAKEWWHGQSEDYALCDGCNNSISKGGGFLVGSYLYCVNCANEKFKVDAIWRLRADPNFFGVGVLEKAREYISSKELESS